MTHYRRHIICGLMLALPFAARGQDIQFTGSGINFLGSAKGGNIGVVGATTYTGLTLQTLQLLASGASGSPIPLSELTVGDVFGVETVNGNFGKAMVTATATASSVTFQYTDYPINGSTGPSGTVTLNAGQSFSFDTGQGGAGGGPAPPTITAIMNNSSTIPSGFPNYGIAPSSIFQVQGANLATAGTTATGTLQNVYPSGSLPTTLGGASAKVTVGSTTVTPAFWYASPTQLALELPSNTPAGTGTLTVTVGGATTTSPITVVAAAPGIDVYNGNTGVLQDSVTGAIISPTNSAKPGETVTLWGTGFGADAADSDVSYTTTPHTIITPLTVYLGSVQVPASNIVYAGSLGYPGVGGIIFTVPVGPVGCFVSIAVEAGTGSNAVVSNITTDAFMPNGGVCSDPGTTGLTGSTIGSLTGSATVRSGLIFVAQSTSPGTSGAPVTTNGATAIFEQVTGANSFNASQSLSLGSCTISEALTATGTLPSVTGLNPGTLTVTPPGGSAITMQTNPVVGGQYSAQLPAIPGSGGTFAFAASGGTGSNAVGAFNTTVNFPSPIINWTNQSAAATVTKSAGLTFNWTGGGAGSYVIMSGNSSSSTTGTFGSWTCTAPVSAGSFTVAPYILQSMPSGTGMASLENSTSFVSFTASGLDYGVAFGGVSVSVNTTWQ
jgi:uncharacterized protein (TIGR03437 family)